MVNPKKFLAEISKIQVGYADTGGICPQNFEM
jgi:hypothetical protein